jgi:hypothetical protein
MGSMRPGRAVEVETHLLVGSVSCAASCVTRLARGRVGSRVGRVWEWGGSTASADKLVVLVPLRAECWSAGRVEVAAPQTVGRAAVVRERVVEVFCGPRSAPAEEGKAEGRSERDGLQQAFEMAREYTTSACRAHSRR